MQASSARRSPELPGVVRPPDTEEALPDRSVRHSTLADETYRQLRAAIVSGELRPGEKLVVRPLEKRLGVSPTPIKAALVALDREGFITAVPHRGYYVTEITADDMHEIYELREALEPVAARNASGHERRGELADRLSELIRQQFARVEAGDLVGYSDLDLEFHRCIWTFAANRRLQQIVDNLVAQVRFGSGRSCQLEGRLPRALDEHVAILNAIRNGDLADAAAESGQHVRAAGEAFTQYFASQEKSPSN